MTENNFTSEAIEVLKHIKTKLIQEYPSYRITIEYFLLSVLQNSDSVAYKMLSRSTLTSTLESLKTWLITALSEFGKGNITSNEIVYDSMYDRCIEYGKKNFSSEKLNSGHILLAVLKTNDVISKHLKKVNITYEQLLSNLKEVMPKDNSSQQDKKLPIQSQIQKGAVEELLIDVNRLAYEGKIDEVIGNDGIINSIFSALSKRDRNNVVVVGDSGVGKTSTVLHIANLINRGDVPKSFRNKKLMKLDFTSLVAGSAVRGNFEMKLNAIISDAVKKNGYIFFVDDMQAILSDRTKFSEIDTENLLDMFLMERNIQFVCTMDSRSYSSCILSNPSFKRRFQKVTMVEKTDEEAIEILKTCKTKYEKYHNVVYSDDAIEDCVKLSRRYVKDAKLPDYALDILDETGAKKTMLIAENNEIERLKIELNTVKRNIRETSYSEDKSEYDKYDDLLKKEIEIKSKIAEAEKEEVLNYKPLEVTSDDIRQTISLKTNIPVTKLTIDEKTRLKNLGTNLKNVVIGQDDAVDEVACVVKRQRVGLSNKNRPVVLFFAGMTGVGKTYLAKKLAEEVFGNENCLVRLDMSEYSDSTSVTKLYGTGMGYIGYDKGGILTEAIKKNNHCVLLLDEMEKANDEVHNVFLQLFDEGRLTDNTGITVDFSNVIVIMTSNVGAKEISAKGKGIGFVSNESNSNKEAISKAMKSKFAPEFINRIDRIIFFNKLSEENIKDIISLELKKLSKRVEEIGYKLGETLTDNSEVNELYEKVKKDSDYGARPILHIIRKEIEDKITDYIIDNQPNSGFVFEKELFV